MNLADELEDRIKHLRVVTDDAVDQRILADASAALVKAQSVLLDAKPSSVWRNIMRNQWARLAAGLLIAATIGMLMFHRQFATAAYALEQTLEANLGLRSIHIRVEPAGDGMSETWATFGDDGKLLRAKMEFPKTEDGAKQVVWQGDRAEVWFKTKGSVLVIRDEAASERIAQEVLAFDPRTIVQGLHDAQAKGKVSIETQPSKTEGGPIRLVVSFTDSPDKREIYQVNPQTKLVEKLEKYNRVGGEFQPIGSIDFLEYNQEIPPAIFVLNVPADVTRVDWTTQKVGLPKGDLTNDQIAVKVAREFFAALIAKDYGRAGRIFSGIPAAEMEKLFGKIEFTRIISVGKPTPHPDARTRFLQVPCEVEFRVDGNTHVKKFVPNIRPADGQSDRWLIGGGI